MSEFGHLIIIGGAEDKTGACTILRQAHTLLGPDAPVAVLTTATEAPHTVGAEYRRVFHRLGMRRVTPLPIDTRDEANDPHLCRTLHEAGCIFLTGGDQLRLTSILGGTAAHAAIRALYGSGGLVMGTSAGASALSATMIVRGEDNEPARKCTLKMAPGLGLLDGVLIDQHFDQRGRFGRLLCGVAENPAALGLGIDEDTAVHVYGGDRFDVLGSNAVTVMDGRSIRATNVSEQAQSELLAIVGVTLHTLPSGCTFDLAARDVLKDGTKKHESD